MSKPQPMSDTSHTILLRHPLPKYSFKGKKLPKETQSEAIFSQSPEYTGSQSAAATGLSGNAGFLSVAASQPLWGQLSITCGNKSVAKLQAPRALGTIRAVHPAPMLMEQPVGEIGRTTKPTATVAARMLKKENKGEDNLMKGDRKQGVTSPSSCWLAPQTLPVQQIEVPNFITTHFLPGSPDIQRCHGSSSQDNHSQGDETAIVQAVTSHQRPAGMQLVRPLMVDVGQGREDRLATARILFASEVAVDSTGTIDGNYVPFPGPGLLACAAQAPTEADKLQKAQEEVEKLKSQLEVQLQVNSELKRLLVASVGEDFERRIENLARDRAELAMELGDYTKKMTEDYEHLDQIAIQADMWRSKYLASRVMVEELASARAFYSVQYQDSQQAMQQLLNERFELRADLLQAYKCLQQVKEAFDPLNAHRSIGLTSTNVLDIAKNVKQLSEAVRFRLLPSNICSTVILPLEESFESTVTKAEIFAYELLSKQANPPAMKHLLPPGLLASPRSCERFHPQARHENLTLHCCPKCKGEMSVV